MLDEPADQRLTELERKVSVDLELAAAGKQITEMLPSINRPTTVPDVCAQAIWDFHPGL